jgi:hypothetical protein
MLDVGGGGPEMGGGVPVGVVDRSRIIGEPMFGLSCRGRLAFSIPGEGVGAVAVGSIWARYCWIGAACAGGSVGNRD